MSTNVTSSKDQIIIIPDTSPSQTQRIQHPSLSTAAYDCGPCNHFISPQMMLDNLDYLGQQNRPRPPPNPPKVLTTDSPFERSQQMARTIPLPPSRSHSQNEVITSQLPFVVNHFGVPPSHHQNSVPTDRMGYYYPNYGTGQSVSNQNSDFMVYQPPTMVQYHPYSYHNYDRNVEKNLYGEDGKNVIVEDAPSGYPQFSQPMFPPQYQPNYSRLESKTDRRTTSNPVEFDQNSGIGQIYNFGGFVDSPSLIQIDTGGGQTISSRFISSDFRWCDNFSFVYQSGVFRLSNKRLSAWFTATEDLETDHFFCEIRVIDSSCSSIHVDQSQSLVVFEIGTNCSSNVLFVPTLKFGTCVVKRQHLFRSKRVKFITKAGRNGYCKCEITQFREYVKEHESALEGKCSFISTFRLLQFFSFIYENLSVFRKVVSSTVSFDARPPVHKQFKPEFAGKMLKKKRPSILQLEKLCAVLQEMNVLSSGTSFHERYFSLGEKFLDIVSGGNIGEYLVQFIQKKLGESDQFLIRDLLGGIDVAEPLDKEEFDLNRELFLKTIRKYNETKDHFTKRVIMSLLTSYSFDYLKSDGKLKASSATFYKNIDNDGEYDSKERETKIDRLRPFIVEFLNDEKFSRMVANRMKNGEQAMTTTSPPCALFREWMKKKDPEVEDCCLNTFLECVPANFVRFSHKNRLTDYCKYCHLWRKTKEKLERMTRELLRLEEECRKKVDELKGMKIKNLRQRKKKLQEIILIVEKHRELSKLQRAAYNKLIEGLPLGQILLVIDFKQNIVMGPNSCETGMVFFNHAQRTILGIVCFYNLDGKVERHTYFVYSDILNHTQQMSVFCLRKLFSKSFFGDDRITKINFFMDKGGHFLGLEALHYFMVELRLNRKVDVSANFFVECHGKNICDLLFALLSLWLRQIQFEGEYVTDEALLAELRKKVLSNDERAGEISFLPIYAREISPDPVPKWPSHFNQLVLNDIKHFYRFDSLLKDQEDLREDLREKMAVIRVYLYSSGKIFEKRICPVKKKARSEKGQKVKIAPKEPEIAIEELGPQFTNRFLNFMELEKIQDASTTKVTEVEIFKKLAEVKKDRKKKKAAEKKKKEAAEKKKKEAAEKKKKEAAEKKKKEAAEKKKKKKKKAVELKKLDNQDGDEEEIEKNKEEEIENDEEEEIENSEEEIEKDEEDQLSDEDLLLARETNSQKEAFVSKQFRENAIKKLPKTRVKSKAGKYAEGEDCPVCGVDTDEHDPCLDIIGPSLECEGDCGCYVHLSCGEGMEKTAEHLQEIEKLIEQTESVKSRNLNKNEKIEVQDSYFAEISFVCPSCSTKKRKRRRSPRNSSLKKVEPPKKIVKKTTQMILIELNRKKLLKIIEQLKKGNGKRKNSGVDYSFVSSFYGRHFPFSSAVISFDFLRRLMRDEMGSNFIAEALVYYSKKELEIINPALARRILFIQPTAMFQKILDKIHNDNFVFSQVFAMNETEIILPKSSTKSTYVVAFNFPELHCSSCVLQDLSILHLADSNDRRVRRTKSLLSLNGFYRHQEIETGLRKIITVRMFLEHQNNLFVYGNKVKDASPATEFEDTGTDELSVFKTNTKKLPEIEEDTKKIVSGIANDLNIKYKIYPSGPQQGLTCLYYSYQTNLEIIGNLDKGEDVEILCNERDARKTKENLLKLMNGENVSIFPPRLHRKLLSKFSI